MRPPPPTAVVPSVRLRVCFQKPLPLQVSAPNPGLHLLGVRMLPRPEVLCPLHLQPESLPLGRENGRTDTQNFPLLEAQGWKVPKTSHASLCFQPVFHALLGGLLVETAPENSSPSPEGSCLQAVPVEYPCLVVFVFPHSSTDVRFECARAGVMFVTGTETRFSQFSIPCKPSNSKAHQKALCDFRMFVNYSKHLAFPYVYLRSVFK